MDTKFIIYIIPNCSFCTKAIQLLTTFKFKYDIVNVLPEEKEALKKKNNMNTFPQIFLESNNTIETIGGFDNLFFLFRIAETIEKKNLSIDVIKYIHTEIKKQKKNDSEVDKI